MKKDPLMDKDFLKALDQENQREVFAKIASLTFEEHPIEFITGRVTGGSVNIDGQSSTRRTCSLTLVAKELNIHDFYWGLNTKMELFIGLKNKINPEYDDIIWFPQGIFLITDFSTNQTTNNYTISISGRDKMSLLNGDIGGIVNSLTADFGKIEEIDIDGNITILSIPLKDIIREVVHEYAREPFENIIIEDLDEIGLELMEYRGNNPMYFLLDDKTNEVSNMFDVLVDANGKQRKYSWSQNKNGPYTDENDEEHMIALDDPNFILNTRVSFFGFSDDATHIRVKDPVTNIFNTYTVFKAEYGDVIGFRETDLTYAGELIGKIGDSITKSCLDPIKNMLGNFEYFYDIDGRFHFRRKKTYLNISWNNLIEEEDTGEIYANATILTQTSYSFENANLITAFQNKPQLSNLKNDYSIWGTKITTGGKEYPVHLRYAIDKKPVYYKTYDGRIYSTIRRSQASIQKEITDNLAGELAKQLSNHVKAPLPYGLSDQWWQMEDWGRLYRSLLHPNKTYEENDFTDFPTGGLDDYTSGYDYLDLETLFPGSRKNIWSNWQNRPLHIFDVIISEDGNLNAPLYSVVHNPYCGHNFTSYFIEGGKRYGYVSYIYNPKFPDSINQQINQTMLKKIMGQQHWGCDWREILYQMACDYLKYEHDPDFLSIIAGNNPDYYPSGYTGYEMYYTDIVSFWRDIYNPEYKYTKIPAYVTKSLYDQDPTKYYWFEKCDETTAYSFDEVYYIKNKFEEYTTISVSYDEFYKNNNYNKYWYLRQGSSSVPYNKDYNYFIKQEGDFVTQKYLGVEVEKYSDLPESADPAIVYYVLSDQKYYAYNTSTKSFKLLYTERSDDFSVYEDPKTGEWKIITDANKLVQNPKFGWNNQIIDAPQTITFWFDFLDSADGSLTAYNVRNVGDRPKSVNDSNVKAIYYRDTPTIIFIDSELSEEEKRIQKQLKPGGYTFILFPEYMEPAFNVSTQKKCAKDVLEEWLYEYTKCTESITITSLPVYYLEPNTRISVYDENSGINGEYIVNKISYSLTYNATMSIQAVKAVDRIY